MVFNLMGHDIVISDEIVKEAKETLLDDLSNETTFNYYLGLAFPGTAANDVVNGYCEDEIAERVINAVREDIKFSGN